MDLPTPPLQEVTAISRPIDDIAPDINLLPLRTNKCAARGYEVPDYLSGSNGLGSRCEISKKMSNPQGGTRFFYPPFHSVCVARGPSTVPDARPQWESGRGGHNYSGALALYTAATRGVLRTAASGLDVRMTSADSALSRYPSRRTDQFFPKPRGEGVRPTATLIAIHL